MSESGIRSAVTKLVEIVGDVVPASRVGEKGAHFRHAPTNSRENPPRTRGFFIELADVTHDGVHMPGDAKRTVGLDLVLAYDAEQDTTELLIAQVEDYEAITAALLTDGLYGSSSIIDIAGGEADILLADNEYVEEPSRAYLVTYRIPLTYRATS